MDTKLKNRHKRAAALILMVIMIPTFIMVGQYPKFYKETVYEQEESLKKYICSDSFLTGFLRSSYILYYSESETQLGEELLHQYFGSYEDSFEEMMPYMDYQVQNSEGEILIDNLENGDGTSAKKMTTSSLENYAFGLALRFDEDGEPGILEVSGKYRQQQLYALKKVINNKDSYAKDEYTSSEGLQPPQNRVYYYAFTEDDLNAYIEEELYISSSTVDDITANVIMVLIALVVLAALILPHFKSLHTGEEWLFCAPLELVCIVASCGLGILGNYAGWIFTRSQGRVDLTDYIIWIFTFALSYWTASCLRQIHVLGIRRYWKERTWCYPLWGYLKFGIRRVKEWVSKQSKRIYHSLGDLDFSEKNNRIILKIVLANFVILLVLCSMWFFGIVGLIIYSVLLFWVLQKYFNDLRSKYALLLKATNEIAEGNLDVEIEGDLGVFSPFRTEIQKIQSGFKKAVKEEVKSQRLKSELITNVSHDLKTPLTAIITYVNLLKDEKDEEKCRDYIQILEQKSMRLKALIEDLFEISKASSENVTLNLVNVDIVNLFKQVKLELDDKIQQLDLSFRMNFPSDKLILYLDSQKTYRIFENLLGNVVKYAMPHTRVFVEMEKEGKEAVIRMKNISETELTFNPEEITERFVRGDTSRNTEGSGLGLAIVKSFVELQKGRLHIETEADLFKVEIRWPIPETFS